jgi:ABC-type antimicrobial peptide transport system permease subunit
MGASEFGIVYLLSADFTKIVGVAIIVALPVSYLITRYWLESFAFRISLEWWYFGGAGIAAVAIAWLTVGTQAFRAARISPAKCLKNE